MSSSYYSALLTNFGIPNNHSVRNEGRNRDANWHWWVSLIYANSLIELSNMSFVEFIDITKIYSKPAERLAMTGDEPVLYIANRGIYQAQPTTTPIKGFDKEKVFNQYIFPKLQQFYQFKISDPSIDVVVKRTITEWWEQKSTSLWEKFSEISTALNDSIGSLPFNTGTLAATAKIGSYIINETWFKDLFAGTLTTSAVSPILEVFGWTDYIRENDGRWGTPPTFDGTIEGFQTAATTNPGWYKDALMGMFGLEEPSPEAEMDLKQCALVTGLLHKGTVDFHKYYEISYYNSPLYTGSYANPSDINSGHYRIYPVESALFDPNIFMNYATVDKSAKDVMTDVATIADGTEMTKHLFWVYEASGSGEIREAEIPLGSRNSQKADRNKLRKLRNALRVYNTSGLAGRQLNNAVTKAYGKAITAVNAQKEYDKISQSFLKTKNHTYYFLKETTIKFEGTNPSTARKSVDVSLNFEISSMTGLETVLLTLGTKDGLPNNTEVKLMDLITLPRTKMPSIKNGPGQYLTNHYSPNYSRLRLKVAAKDSYQSMFDSALILDLSIVDHTLSRDSETGATTLTINYKGYFETMMNMPFNDALASNTIRDKRIARQMDGLDKLMSENCKPETVREAMRIEQESFSREARAASFSSILERLFIKNLVHYYTLDNTAFAAGSIGGTLDSRKNYVISVNASAVGGNTSTEQQDTATLEAEMEKNKDSDDAKTAAELIDDLSLSSLKNRFFFLGDLMWTLLDVLYKDDSAELLDHVKNLNMRFIASTIYVPDPNNLSGSPLKINPLCIPIDLSFFTQWFNSVVAKKGLSYYPIGTFIRDLIERMVSGIIYDTCFSLLLPDEKPPILRVEFFENSESNWFTKEPNKSTWDPNKPFGTLDPNRKRLFLNSINNANLVIGDNSAELDSTNYCVIYQQQPSFVRQLNYSQGAGLKTSPYTASIYYGAKNKEFNFLSNVSFSKTNIAGLKESRFFNNNFGNLSLLSNVYDLSFSFLRRKGNTLFFPGNIINFYLVDWGQIWDKSTGHPHYAASGSLGDSDPHVNNTMSNILGMGGYFTIKSVEYSLGETSGEFEIKINTVFSGTDAARRANSVASQGKKVTDSQKCADAFNVIAERANELYETGDEIFSLAEGTGNASTPTQQNNNNNSNTARVQPAQSLSFEDQLKNVVQAMIPGATPLQNAPNYKKITLVQIGNYNLSNNTSDNPFIGNMAKTIHSQITGLTNKQDVVIYFKQQNTTYEVKYMQASDSISVTSTIGTF